LFFCKRPLLRDSSDAVKTVAKHGSLFDLQGVLRFGGRQQAASSKGSKGSKQSRGVTAASTV
jgi:hypothetical protein